MKPGERLTPIREVQVNDESLITMSGKGAAQMFRAAAPGEDLAKRFTTRKRSFLGAEGAGSPRGRRRELRGGRGRMPGHRRRVGLRQDHDRAHDPALSQARLRRDHFKEKC